MAKSVRKIVPQTAPLQKKKRVAAYARVSTAKDAMLKSLSAQVSHYSAFIQKHPEWEFAGVYADEALSGTKDTRPEFNRMLEDCRAGKIDMIITKRISRFARNTVVLLSFVRELKAIGVTVWFESENLYSDNGEGEMVLTLLASVAQEESRAVSENCKWRIRNRLKQGELVSLRDLYGYTITKDQIEIDPEQAEVVRSIFDAYLNGVGCRRIAETLRFAGVPTYRGGQWTEARIYALLKNEKFAGNALLQKKFVTDHITKKEVRNKGQLPMYFAECTHPAIIEIAQFEAVQARLEENRKKNNISKLPAEEYPFTAKITCEQCGKSYRRKVNNGNPHWQCATYLLLGKQACPAKQIPENVLYSLCKEALGLSEFDKAAFERQIEGIWVPESNQIKIVFKNGRVEHLQWQDRSRRESWTDEMRDEAAQRQREYVKRRAALCQQQEQ